MNSLLSPQLDVFIIKSTKGWIYHQVPKWTSPSLDAQMDEIIIRSTSRRVPPNYSPSPLRDKYILKDEQTYAYLKVKINT